MTKSSASRRRSGSSEAEVPADVVARSHVSFAESFAEGLIEEIARLEADAIVVGGSGGGLAGPLLAGLGGQRATALVAGSGGGGAAGYPPHGRRPGPRGDVRASANARAQICCCAPRFGSARRRARRCGWCRWWRSTRRTASFAVTRTRFGSVRSHTPQQTLETAKEALPEDIPVTSTIVDGPTVEDAVEQARLARRRPDHGRVEQAERAQAAVPRLDSSEDASGARCSDDGRAERRNRRRRPAVNEGRLTTRLVTIGPAAVASPAHRLLLVEYMTERKEMTESVTYRGVLVGVDGSAASDGRGGVGNS